MDKDFTQVMSERTDKQLADILVLNRADYVPEAIEAAEKEFHKRGLDVNTFYNQQQVDEIKVARETYNENRQFEWYHILITILSPLVVCYAVAFFLGKVSLFMYANFLGLPLIIGIYFLIHYKIKEAGYIRMAEDFKKWITYTLYIYIAFFVVLIILALIFGVKGLL